MKRRTGELIIVLLSGRVASGKSSLAKQVVLRHEAELVETRDLIRIARPRVGVGREGLKRAGDALDRETDGAWIATALVRLIEERRDPSGGGIFVVDSIRIPEQARAIRKVYGPNVHHIHLVAHTDELARRYGERNRDGEGAVPYQRVAAGKTERRSGEVEALADIVIQTDHCSHDSVRVRAMAILDVHCRRTEPLVDVLVGGQYGSEGKGNIVGHIAPEYDLLVRVGGPNAGHQVFGDPIEKYYHLPSGTQRAGSAKLLLGAGSVLNVEKLQREIIEHRVDADRLRIDRHAVIISEADIRLESIALSKISSTGQGVGAATARKILRRTPDESRRARLASDISALAPYLCDAQEILEKAYVNGDRILLEGTQGTSLSMHHGPYPYVTSRDTTAAGCLADAGIAPGRVRRVIMVCRTYPIRVGGPSGPMEGLIDWETVSARSSIPLEELTTRERTTTTNRERRVAEFDWMQLSRSVLLNGPTDIALTFVDYLGVKNRRAHRFEQLTEQTLRFIEEVERVSGVPVTMISTSFDWRNVIDRRSW
jgi:adenylosuccinate synthase